MNPPNWYNVVGGGQNPHQQHYPPYQQTVPEYSHHDFAVASAEPSFSAPTWVYDSSHQHQPEHQHQHQHQQQQQQPPPPPPSLQQHQPQHQPQPQGEPVFTHPTAHGSNYGPFGELQQHPYGNASFVYQPDPVGNQFSVGFPGQHQSAYQGHVTPDPVPIYFQPPAPRPVPTYHQPSPIAPQTNSLARAPVTAPARVPVSTPVRTPVSAPVRAPINTSANAPTGTLIGTSTTAALNGVRVSAPSGGPAGPLIGTPVNSTHPGQNMLADSQASQAHNPVVGVRPVEAQWRHLEGLPNVVFSNVPDPAMRVDPIEIKKYRGKRTWPALNHNFLGTKLVPDRSRRLPGEILRDFDIAKSRMNDLSLDDNAKAQIQTQIKALESEWLAVTGESIKNIGDAKSRTKGLTDDDSDSSDEGDEIDRRAREIKFATLSPEDSVKVVEQKVVNIVWQDPSDPPLQNAIAVAISEYGALIEELWAKHKLLNKEHKEATAEQKDVQARALQDALKRQTELIHVAVETTNMYGADSILDNMGKNQKLTIILLNFVRYCYTLKDYNGPAPKSVLHLISGFTTLSTEFLGKLKLEQLRTKYSKELDTESCELLDQIFDNAKRRDKQRPQPSTETHDTKKTLKTPTTTVTSTVKETQAAPKPQVVKKDSATKSAMSDIKRMQPIKYAGLESARKVSNGTSTKRPRDDDSDSRSSKKVAVEGTSGTLAANKQSSISTASSSAPPPGTVTTTTAQTRPKTSASILPGKSRPIVKPASKKAEPQPQAQPQKQPQRSVLGSLLEEIAKPKEVPKPREEPERPETEEEKARRLRKESRRGRRVTWASEDQLVQYRYFQHDSAEDEGRARNQLRDVRDNRSEGQMLKLLARGKKEKEDGEESEDEDEEDVKETSLKEWKDPSVSERTLSQERVAKNFERRGGSQKADTPQQKFINDYESRELMSIYTTVSEIPVTPRSPPKKAITEPLSKPSVAPASTSPKAHEIYRRVVESQQFGSFGAAQQAIARLATTINLNPTRKSAYTSSNNPSSVQSLSRMMTQEERDAEVLALLKSKQVAAWIDPNPYDPARPKTQRRYDYPDPKVQEAANAIELIIEEFKDKPFPPTEPPKWLQDNPGRVKEWWNGHNANAAKIATAKVAPSAVYPLFPVSQQQYPQPQQDASPYVKMLQQIQAIQASQAGQVALSTQPQTATQPQMTATPDIQSLLKTLSQSAPAAQAQAPVQAPAVVQPTTTLNTDPNAAAWMAYYAQIQNQGQAAYQQQQKQQQPPASGYNAEMNAAQWAAYYQQYQNQTQGQQQGQGSSSYGQEHQNDDDSDRRDRDRDRRNNNDRPRGNNNVNRGGGDRDSRGINRSLIGTKPCTFWAKNQCTKGDKCTFRHDPADLVSSNY